MTERAYQVTVEGVVCRIITVQAVNATDAQNYAKEQFRAVLGADNAEVADWQFPKETRKFD